MKRFNFVENRVGGGRRLLAMLGLLALFLCVALPARAQEKRKRKAGVTSAGDARRANKEAASGSNPASAGALRFADMRLATGVRLHYAEAGDPAGAPVIMLHGYTDSSFSFSRALSYLDRRHHVYLLDQRGHGDSERPASGYAFSDFVADVIAFMDAKGIARATLVGHSMGSFIAQGVALAAPARVEGLVLVGSATTVRNDVVLELRQALETLPESVPEKFAREFQLGTVHLPMPDEFMDRVVAESRKLPTRAWRAVMEGMLAGDYRARLGEIQAPTLILWGDRDAIFPRSEQDALAAAIAWLMSPTSVCMSRSRPST